MKKIRNLHLDHVEERLKQLKSQDMIARPPKGWIRFIREALNMSSKALAKRVGISPNTMSETEKAEREEAISLRKLTKVANSMNCDLVYYFLPRKPIKEMIDERARYVTEQDLRNAGLESNDENIFEGKVNIEIETLKYSKKLWDK